MSEKSYYYFDIIRAHLTDRLAVPKTIRIAGIPSDQPRVFSMLDAEWQIIPYLESDGSLRIVDTTLDPGTPDSESSERTEKLLRRYSPDGSLTEPPRTKSEADFPIELLHLAINLEQGMHSREQSFSIEGFGLYRLIQTGALLASGEIIDQLQKKYIDVDITPLKKIMDPVTTLIDGRSLQKVLRKGLKFNLQDVTDWFIISSQAYLAMHTQNYQALLAGEYADQDQSIHHTTSAIAFANAMDSLYFLHKAKTLAGVPRIAFERTATMIQRAEALRRRMLELLVSPYDREYTQFVEVVAPYLAELNADIEGSITPEMIHTLGIDTPASFIYVYRQATQLAQQGIYAEFNENLTRAIETTLETVDYQVFQHTDLESVINAENEDKVVNVDSIKQLAVLTNKISSYKFKPEYEFPFEELPLAVVNGLESAVIILNKSQPAELKVTFSIRKASSDVTELDCVINSKNGYMDWNSLASPHELAPQANQLILYIKQGLEKIEMDLQNDFDQKTKEKRALPANEVKKSKLKGERRTSDQSKGSRQQIKPPVPTPMSPISERLQDVAIEQRPRIEQSIEIPNEFIDQYSELYGRSTAELFKKKIERFNKSGLGWFKYMSEGALGGMWALRVRDANGTAYRVLLRESTKSKKGKQIFEIEDIMRRRDIDKY